MNWSVGVDSEDHFSAKVQKKNKDIPQIPKIFLKIHQIKKRTVKETNVYLLLTIFCAQSNQWRELYHSARIASMQRGIDMIKK